MGASATSDVATVVATVEASSRAGEADIFLTCQGGLKVFQKWSIMAVLEQRTALHPG